MRKNVAFYREEQLKKTVFNFGIEMSYCHSGNLFSILHLLSFFEFTLSSHFLIIFNSNSMHINFR